MAKRDVLETLRDAEHVALRELNAIRAAIQAIAGTLASGGAGRRGRPRRGTPNTAALEVSGRKPRRLSPAARKRISDAQKARWAKHRAAAKKA
jgi:hypothetical protein